MRWMRAGQMGLLVWATGCANDRLNWTDPRPAANPGPTGTKAELRDARFFLPLPDDTIGPRTGMEPPNSRRSAIN